jgi:hypothetical protein
MRIALLIAGSLALSASAAELMPLAQQDELVQKYCAVCHSNATPSGGLSLERFLAEGRRPSSLFAMMLSKLTGGASLETARNVDTDPNAAAVVNRKMKSGAMGAAGIPIPDKATIDALIHALAMESTDATTGWEFDVSLFSSSLAARPTSRVSWSIMREFQSAANAAEARAYRLKLTCDAETKTGSTQLAWAPMPTRGTLSASVDGAAPVSWSADGSATELTFSRIPADSLTISGLFPDETVTFPFTNFPSFARREFQECFPDAGH